MTAPTDRLAEALRLAEAMVNWMGHPREPHMMLDSARQIARLIREEIAARSERERIAVEALREIVSKWDGLFPRKECGQRLKEAAFIARRALNELGKPDASD